MKTRVGAVGYLNARPLTWALDQDRARWEVRYDLPAVCARLLHDGEVDLGLIPSVEFLGRPDYRLVPGVGIGSRGAVASVALFTRMDMRDVRRIALDTSSRTSAALTRVLCERYFRIQPAFVPEGPDLGSMLDSADAALLIGDPALETDPAALGLQKLDLGEAWQDLTGLPFVYAAWTGRPAGLDAAGVEALQVAQAAGVAARQVIAREYAGADVARAARAEAYLRDNVRYGLGPDEVAGLQQFLDYAAELGIGPQRTLEFY